MARTHLDAYTEQSWCVFCGFCCQQAMCATGRFEALNRRLIDDLCKKVDTCPFLKWNGPGFICEIADKYYEQLAIGAGCCSPMFNTHREAMLAQV